MRQLSHSQMGEWPDDSDPRSPGCQLKWAFNHVWKVPQPPNEAGILGDGVHAALEADGRHKLDGGAGLSLGELISLARAAIDKRLAKDDPGRMLADRRANMMQRAESILSCYVRHVQQFYHPSSAPERSFDIEIGGVRFTGKIDAKARQIIDWKQTKELVNKWGREWIENPEHADQATAYMIADPEAEAVQFIVFACHPDRPDVCHVKKYIVKRDAARERRYTARVPHTAKAMDEAVHAEAFSAKTGPLCAWCPFVHQCAVGLAWTEAAGRKIETPRIAHTAPCDCGGQAEALRYTFSDDRGSGRVASVVWLCKTCGCQFVTDARKRSHAKETAA